ncbi:MAG: hypothetical protein QM689_08585 [Oscillospiraceae bacterium]
MGDVMAKYCRECGLLLNDDAQLCGVCGTSTAEKTIPVSEPAPIVRKKGLLVFLRRKIGRRSLAAVIRQHKAITAAAFAGLLLTGAGAIFLVHKCYTPYDAPFAAICVAWNLADADNLDEIIPEQLMTLALDQYNNIAISRYNEDYSNQDYYDDADGNVSYELPTAVTEDMVIKKLNDAIVQSKKSFSNDAEMTFEIYHSRRLDDAELARIKRFYRTNTGGELVVERAYSADVCFTIEDSENTERFCYNLTSGLCDGEWLLIDAEHFAEDDATFLGTDFDDMMDTLYQLTLQ